MYGHAHQTVAITRRVHRRIVDNLQDHDVAVVWNLHSPDLELDDIEAYESCKEPEHPSLSTLSKGNLGAVAHSSFTGKVLLVQRS